jgi:hypothetical protein
VTWWPFLKHRWRSYTKIVASRKLWINHVTNIEIKLVYHISCTNKKFNISFHMIIVGRRNFFVVPAFKFARLPATIERPGNKSWHHYLKMLINNRFCQREPDVRCLYVLLLWCEGSQWLRIALSNGTHRVGATPSPFFTWRRRQSQFPKRCF